MKNSITNAILMLAILLNFSPAFSETVFEKFVRVSLENGKLDLGTLAECHESSIDLRSRLDEKLNTVTNQDEEQQILDSYHSELEERMLGLVSPRDHIEKVSHLRRSIQYAAIYPFFAWGPIPKASGLNESNSLDTNRLGMGFLEERFLDLERLRAFVDFMTMQISTGKKSAEDAHKSLELISRLYLPIYSAALGQKKLAPYLKETLVISGNQIILLGDSQYVPYQSISQESAQFIKAWELADLNTIDPKDAKDAVKRLKKQITPRAFRIIDIAFDGLKKVVHGFCSFSFINDSN